ncbi:hypothetical protein ADUPG1_009856, partial [Aduncisulcus paluster]
MVKEQNRSSQSKGEESKGEKKFQQKKSQKPKRVKKRRDSKSGEGPNKTVKIDKSVKSLDEIPAKPVKKLIKPHKQSISKKENSQITSDKIGGNSHVSGKKSIKNSTSQSKQLKESQIDDEIIQFGTSNVSSKAKKVKGKQSKKKTVSPVNSSDDNPKQPKDTIAPRESELVSEKAKKTQKKQKNSKKSSMTAKKTKSVAFIEPESNPSSSKSDSIPYEDTKDKEQQKKEKKREKARKRKERKRQKKEGESRSSSEGKEEEKDSADIKEKPIVPLSDTILKDSSSTFSKKSSKSVPSSNLTPIIPNPSITDPSITDSPVVSKEHDPYASPGYCLYAESSSD